MELRQGLRQGSRQGDHDKGPRQGNLSTLVTTTFNSAIKIKPFRQSQEGYGEPRFPILFVWFTHVTFIVK